MQERIGPAGQADLQALHVRHRRRPPRGQRSIFAQCGVATWGWQQESLAHRHIGYPHGGHSIYGLGLRLEVPRSPDRSTTPRSATAGASGSRLRRRAHPRCRVGYPRQGEGLAHRRDSGPLRPRDQDQAAQRERRVVRPGLRQLFRLGAARRQHRARSRHRAGRRRRQQDLRHEHPPRAKAAGGPRRQGVLR